MSAMHGTLRARARSLLERESFGFWLGLTICVVVALVDISLTNLVVISLVLLGPLVAAGLSSPRRTALLAGIGLLIALGLGWVDNIWFTTRLVAALVTVSIGGLTAIWLATLRAARDRQLRAVEPALARASRLSSALRAGRTGSWSWDRSTDVVTWDRETESLYGLARGEFDGTFDGWFARIDARDREMIRRTLDELLVSGAPARFDHRCVHPDGSVHWVECTVEVRRDRRDVAGAFGLVRDIGERMAELDERDRLLNLERRARQRSEYLGRVNIALADQFVMDDVLRQVAGSVVPDLADWCSLVVAADRPRSAPIIVYAHADPAKMRAAQQLMAEHPFDPDAGWGAAGVLTSGKTEFIAEVPAEAFRGEGATLADFDPRSVVTAPLRGALGTLGAIQLIRTGQRRFQESDVELIDELADRVGTAVNNAVVFARQARTREMLDLLQRLSGRLAVSATRQDVIDLVEAPAWADVGLSEIDLYLLDDDHLTDARTGEPAPADVESASMRSDPLVSPPMVVLPLAIMRRRFGALVARCAVDRMLLAEEITALESLGSRIAGALERTMLYEQQRDNALIMQRRLLPVIPALPNWLSVAAEYRPTPGGAVGGDWYQVIDVGEDRYAAIVGDAVGHGLHAAAAMGQLRAAIAGAASSDPDPDRVLAAAEQFARTAEDTMCATTTYLLLNSQPVVRYASAGHLAPVWVRPGERARLLDGGRRPLLGFGDAHAMPVATNAPFAPGDTIVLYTDGLIERRGRTLDEGLALLQRTVESLADAPVDEVCSVLLERLSHDRDIEDDIAVMALRRN